ncbi:hypothetical protein KIW84_054463 [Lathyrus oleraceus]|uniref:Pentatricopeptide repeat-containing protein n=1 Tax=Pisum sativum TaxID=3888 RepID=A0A9D4WVV8_PEA|nr:hypothetical protein KIW84_054463 [Pisum sativum]
MPHPDVAYRTVLTMGYRFGGMYDDALHVFEQMQYAGVVPNQLTMVNALAACASSGAIEMGIYIHDMDGVRADEVTLVAVLSACSHSGLVDKGLLIFSMLVDGNSVDVEHLRPATEVSLSFESILVFSDIARQNPNFLDLGDAYKLALSNRERQLSGMLTKHWLGKYSLRVNFAKGLCRLRV